MPKAKKDKTANSTRWVMCATSESSDHYCCCHVWDHKPTQEEIDRVRVSLDSREQEMDDLQLDDDDSFLVKVDGKKYSCYIPSWEISKVEV